PQGGPEQPPGAEGGAPAAAGAGEPPRSGPGAESFEATGRTGDGSLRYDRVRNAFANVAGDVVDGDKYVTVVGGARKRLRTLSPLVEERVRFAYHEPPGFPAARDTLRAQRMLILRGAPGYGKTAMAVRLLQGLSADRPLYHLDDDVDFASLADRMERGDDGIEQGVCFLLDRPADIGNLRGEVYEKVRGALAAADAWMVLTVPGGLADSEVLTGVVDVTEPPDPRDVLAAHLRWRLGEAVRAYLLAQDDVRQLVEELLDGGAACKQAAELADAISEEYEGGTLDPQRIRERRARHAAEDVEIWLEGLRAPAERALALALAVLNGLPEENVATAARALRERLEGEPAYLLAPGPDGRLPRPREPFALPRRARLMRLRARYAAKEDGEPGRALAYKDPAYPRQVIAHAWNEYEVQDELLGWLCDLVDDPAEQVRIYAASALGLLAAESFAYVRDRVLRPWAHSEVPARRMAVAHALSVCAHLPWIRERVEEEVGGWFAGRAAPLGQATAARVHGLSAEPDRALDALGRLTVVDHIAVAVAVGCALTDLVAEDAGLVGRVLGLLHTRASDHRGRPTALLSFLIVAAQLDVDRDEWKTGGVLPKWPALLHLAHQREELRVAFVTLWREALNQAHYSSEAEQVLRNWAALAERDPVLLGMFRMMIGAIAQGDSRSGRILRRCAADWVHPDNLAPLPEAARTVNAQLDLERV
ncbi:hypothetical protein ABT160_12375, partial [Streptomyces sp. NPDC001941]|uniref:hypothetical protein n=1 Tax=Streptomyces sp. NPDC001941 TaxID=3154659 RepID=UPI0033269359